MITAQYVYEEVEQGPAHKVVQRVLIEDATNIFYTSVREAIPDGHRVVYLGSNKHAVYDSEQITKLLIDQINRGERADYLIDGTFLHEGLNEEFSYTTKRGVFIKPKPTDSQLTAQFVTRAKRYIKDSAQNELCKKYDLKAVKVTTTKPTNLMKFLKGVTSSPFSNERLDGLKDHLNHLQVPEKLKPKVMKALRDWWRQI